MGVYCTLCGSRLEKCISYHKFPQDVAVRQKWLEFCGLEEAHLNSVSAICSRHFRKVDYVESMKRSVLKRRAIPSKYRAKNTSTKSAKKSQDVGNLNNLDIQKQNTCKESSYLYIPTLNEKTNDECTIKHNVGEVNAFSEDYVVVQQPASAEESHQKLTNQKANDECTIKQNVWEVNAFSEDYVVLQQPASAEESHQKLTNQKANDECTIKQNVWEVNAFSEDYVVLEQPASAEESHQKLTNQKANDECTIKQNVWEVSAFSEDYVVEQQPASAEESHDVIKSTKSWHISLDESASHEDTIDVDDTVEKDDNIVEGESSGLGCVETPRIGVPRYVDDIKLEHLVTPNSVEKTLYLIRTTVQKQRRKIKSLQKTNRELRGRVSYMEDLVNQLKCKKLVSEEDTQFGLDNL